MVFIIEELIYKIPGVLNNNNLKILTIVLNTDDSFFVYLRQNPGTPCPHQSLPSSPQPQPPPFTDSRATMSKGEGPKPEGIGRAQKSVCHCDKLLKGGGQVIIKISWPEVLIKQLRSDAVPIINCSSFIIAFHMYLEMSSAPSTDFPHSPSPEIPTSCSQIIVATTTPTLSTPEKPQN